MAEEATQQTQDTNGKPPEADGEQGGEDQRIPYARFEEVNKRAKQAEKELEDLRNRLNEFEDRDKSEVERAQIRAQRAEQQLNEMMGKVTVMEKGAWIRSAAAELNFHDPEDAVSHLREQLAGLEDHSDAKRLVRNLAKNKKHLVRDDKPQQQSRPIGQMFAGDQVPSQQQAAAGKSPQQQAAERELEFAQGLSQQLSRFREGWHQAGGII
jgi:hypothetical protein